MKKRIADCLWKVNRAMKRKADFVTQQAITSKKNMGVGLESHGVGRKEEKIYAADSFFFFLKKVTRVVNQKSWWMFFIIFFLADRKLNVTHLCPTKKTCSPDLL